MLEKYGATGLIVSGQAYGHAEQSFGKRLENLLGRVLTRQRILPNGQYIDFYDDVSKIGIEYCGLYWHHEKSPTPRKRQYHREKQRVCEQMGIELVTLFEDEWHDHAAQVENVLLARMGAHHHSIGARQCMLETLSVGEANAFLAQEHLQGPSHALRYAWGLRRDRLLAVLTLAPHHRAHNKAELILDRLCFARGVRVPGGASRLLHTALYALHGKGYKSLITWSDNRWSQGDVYARLGFTCVAILPPDYTYVVVTKPRKRLSKQSQMKCRTGCPAHLTEVEWAHQRGLSRVWDCGRKRWQLNLD